MSASPADAPDVSTRYPIAAAVARIDWRFLVPPLALAAAAYLAGVVWPDRSTLGFFATPALYAFSVTAGTALAYVLYARAAIVDDDRLRWLGAGYALACTAAFLQALTLSGFASADPFGLSVSGAAALYLVWQSALVVFAGCALLAVEHRPRRLRRLLVGAVALWIVMTLWEPAMLGLPALVGPDGSFTVLYRAFVAGLLVLGLAVAWFWTLRVIRGATRLEGWIALSLILVALDLVVSAGIDRFFGPVWWASTALRAAQFGVPAFGLLTEFATLSRELLTQQASLAERLRQEAELATAQSRSQLPCDDATRERIRAVLHAGGPAMVFQPIYDLRTGRVFAAEALARFPDEAWGPDVWFQTAESCGLGAELELSAIAAALTRLPELPPDAALAVNISPDLVADPRLADLVGQSAAERVILEVTEHAQVDNYQDLDLALRRLRLLGVRLAIDDAGAGFASLRHILRLNPDIIKLDMSLTRDVHVDPVRRSLAASLVTFASENDVLIVAEGVENADELHALHQLGVPCVQGFHLARPQTLPLTRARPAGLLHVVTEPSEGVRSHLAG